jgi:hypothetical protein
VAPSIPGSIVTGFLFWGFLKENVYKNNPHTLEEFKQILSCLFQTSLQKLLTGLHKTWGKSECMHRWTRWTFPTINITFFVFWFQSNFFFFCQTNLSGMGCVTFDHHIPSRAQMSLGMPQYTTLENQHRASRRRHKISSIRALGSHKWRWQTEGQLFDSR